jgi:O-antigen ligase
MLFISGATFWQQEGVQKIENFSHQATNIETGASVSERSQWRHMALDSFKTHPVFGIGIGNFGRWAHQQDKAVPEAAIVNNEPLELLAETGVVGFGAILTFVLAILWRSWRALREATDELHRIWLVGLTAAVIGIGVQYQTFSTLYITYIWVALGLLVAVQDRIFGAFIPVDVKVEQEQVRSIPKRKKRRR